MRKSTPSATDPLRSWSPRAVASDGQVRIYPLKPLKHHFLLRRKPRPTAGSNSEQLGQFLDGVSRGDSLLG
jgi:hypothetical protein